MDDDFVIIFIASIDKGKHNNLAATKNDSHWGISAFHYLIRREIAVCQVCLKKLSPTTHLVGINATRRRPKKRDTRAP